MSIAAVIAGAGELEKPASAPSRTASGGATAFADTMRDLLGRPAAPATGEDAVDAAAPAPADDALDDTGAPIATAAIATAATAPLPTPALPVGAVPPSGEDRHGPSGAPTASAADMPPAPHPPTLPPATAGPAGGALARATAPKATPPAPEPAAAADGPSTTTAAHPPVAPVAPVAPASTPVGPTVQASTGRVDSAAAPATTPAPAPADAAPAATSPHGAGPAGVRPRVVIAAPVESLAPAPSGATGGGTPAAPASAVPASAPPAGGGRAALAPQLTGPIVSLARAPEGEHRITLTISPESLGPVTVRAHIAGGTVRIELHAPGDAGREALRAILTDLRRDLAAAAPQASLTVSAGDTAPGGTSTGPSGGATGQHADAGSGRPAEDASPRGRPRDDPPRAPAHHAPVPAGADTGIDIFA